MAIGTCIENFSVSVRKALAASTPKRRLRDDRRLQTPAGIADDIRLKIQLRKHRRMTRDTALKAEVNRVQRSVTHRQNEWRNDQGRATLESLDAGDQSLWRMTNEIFYSISPNGGPKGIRSVRLRNCRRLCRKSGDSVPTVDNLSVPAVNEMVDVALGPYLLSRSREPQLTTFHEVQEAIKFLR